MEPQGLAGPATPETLAAVDVPETWHGLWGVHDGQTDRIGNLFLGHWFLPLQGAVDSVEAERESVPAGYLPLAKDFGGAYLALHRATGAVHELGESGEPVILATSLVDLLNRVAAHLEKEPPRRWVAGDNGRRVPDGQRTVTVSDLATWAVGEARDLPEGLVVVRLRSPDPAPFPQHGSRVDFTVDHPEQAGARGRLLQARLVMPTTPEGQGSDATAGVGMQGDNHWIEATGPIPRTAVLHLELDFGETVVGPRPLLHARSNRPSLERARARLLLGDASGALADLEQANPSDPALAAEAALAAGDLANARRFADTLPLGHTIRLRVYAESEPTKALADANHLVEHRPSDGRARVWRADLHERLGDFSAAAADTEVAISLLGALSQEHIPGLRTALRRRRARIAAPRMDAPILEDSTEDFVMGKVVFVEPVGTEWGARVHLTPDEASAGRLVEFQFPDGERGAVRLPRGAGNGVRSTIRVGPHVVRVEVVVDLPHAWSSEGENRTLEFERWDVVATVPRWKRRVKVSGLDGLHSLDWPEGEPEVTVPGAGLLRADGSRGQLRVCVVR